jgi:hypothetical protein
MTDEDIKTGKKLVSRAAKVGRMLCVWHVWAIVWLLQTGCAQLATLGSITLLS